MREISKKSSFREMKARVEKEKKHSDANHTVCALTSDRKLIFRKGEGSSSSSITYYSSLHVKDLRFKWSAFKP